MLGEDIWIAVKLPGEYHGDDDLGLRFAARSAVLACRHLWPEVGDVLLLGRIGRPGRLVVAYLSPRPG